MNRASPPAGTRAPSSPRVSRSREPFLWALFSGGGMAAALLLPALVGSLWVAVPLGWASPPDHGEMLAFLAHPLTRLVVLVLLVLFLFHWAHRFRYTLYDGLQLYHLDQLIALLTYGIATILSVAAVGVVWTLG
jgi:fumarate reductase subunit D